VIQQTNSSIDVDDLMVRVRAEAAAMRATAAAAPASGSDPGVALAPTAFAFTSHADIFALLEDAAKNSAPRTILPKRFDRSPWSLLRPLFRFILRINNYALKDQRHVNAATEMALRLVVADNATLHGQLQHVVQVTEERLQGLMQHCQRLETQLATGAGSRVDALEHAMTTNAHRIDTLETMPLAPRIDALEHAMTLSASRLDRLDALDAAGHVDKLDRSLTDVREHMLRADAAIRADLSAQQGFLMSRALPQESGQAEAVSRGAGIPRAYDSLLLELADRFRGDAATVSSRHRQYLDVIADANVIDDDHPLVDVGSGRGEWLSMLRENNVPSEGIDQSELLVARAREDGLRVTSGDAIASLRGYADATLGAITAFHIVEHLPFEDLIAFLDESLRTLRPNGLLIIETPNPANLVVGACNFWLDPTHIRPIPDALAQFLIEHRGFAQVKVVELTENRAAGVPEHDETDRRLNDFMYGSQEYAIVARRPG
jgi:SAM-dependent methyltransferase